MFFWLNLCWAIFCLLHIRKYTLAYSSHGIFAKLKSAKPCKKISLTLSKRWTRVLWFLLSVGLPLDRHHHCQGCLLRVIPLLQPKATHEKKSSSRRVMGSNRSAGKVFHRKVSTFSFFGVGIYQKLIKLQYTCKSIYWSCFQ